MLKKILCIGLSFSVLAAGVFFTFRKVIILKADARADLILDGVAESAPKRETALHATEKLYTAFTHETYDGHETLARLRPYLSNNRLPAFLRVPSGAIELVMMRGWCDDAGRALIYTLSRRDIHARQWNMIAPSLAHSAVVADLDGTDALLDPYYGYHSLTKNGAVAARDATPANLVAIDGRSNRRFYAGYTRMAKAAQGEPITVRATLPDHSIAIGTVDKNGADVLEAILPLSLTPLWGYVGHKFDRAMTRELIAPHPLRIDFILTDLPNSSVLRTFSPPPDVRGTTLSWRLSKDLKIKSQDGLAGISWTRLNSYIDIDQIIITSEGDTP